MLNVADWSTAPRMMTGCPVLRPRGNGLNLVAPNSHEAVYWDIDSNGFREASGWIAAGMGLLAIDLDQNGAIDNKRVVRQPAAERRGERLSGACRL